MANSPCTEAPTCGLSTNFAYNLTAMEYEQAGLNYGDITISFRYLGLPGLCYYAFYGRAASINDTLKVYFYISLDIVIIHMIPDDLSLSIFLNQVFRPSRLSLSITDNKCLYSFNRKLFP